MDFSPEDLFEAIDRLLSGLMERAGVDRPPVDVLAIATDHLGIPVDYVEPETDEYGRRRAGSRRSAGGITLTEDMTPEQQQAAAANGVARALVPDVLRKLGITDESKQAASHIRGLIVPRLLIPLKLLRVELRTCGFDVLKLQHRFRTASAEVVAQRLLDLDEPCVITIADDGVAAFRKANRFAVTRRLTEAEQQCLDRVMKTDRHERVRHEIWTVNGWPIPNRPFRRIILRAVPDDS